MKMILGQHETRGLPAFMVLACILLACAYTIAVVIETRYHTTMIPWHSLNEPMSLDKPVFVYVHWSQSAPCAKMNDSTFTDPQIVHYLKERFRSLRIDAEEPAGAAFCTEYEITTFPTVLIIKPDNGEEIWRYEGFIAPGKLLAELLAAVP
jgi:thioredoxin-related protein